MVEFPVIITDVNPGFPGWNPQQNVFMCPYTGHYFFIATLFRFQKEGNYVACIRSTNQGKIACSRNWVDSDVTDSIDFSATMSTIMHCEVGEAVWVAMVFHEGTLFDNTDNHNQFQGYLIREDP